MSAPVLLIHGRDDTVVPIEQSREMEGALRAAKKDVQLVVMQGEDHVALAPRHPPGHAGGLRAFLEAHNPP